jgi:predicted SnoaL-like aldol condensation-catalyzing enzyme
MSRTKQEKNKALLLEGFDVLFNKRDFAGAEKYWSPNYIQHSSHIEPGRDGLFNLVKSLPTGSKWEHGIMMAEGDYVMIHSRYSNPDGSAIVVVDIMRIKDGVFEEHWDVIQPEATKEESKSKLPMFGDVFTK